MRLGFGLHRFGFISRIERTGTRRADAALFCVERIAQRKLNPAFLRNQRQALRVVREKPGA